MSSATVVLVPGLYMPAASMGLLARRLRAAGFRPLGFAYRSLRDRPADAAQALAARLEALGEERPHLVGHSLGGLLVRHLLARRGPEHCGRVVTLGTPHGGSQAARWLYAHGCRALLGRSVEGGLLGDLPALPVGTEVGAVVGTVHAGLCRCLPGMPAAGDGVVGLEEAALPGRPLASVATNHIGLLISRAAHRQVIGFLSAGCFVEADE